MNYNVLKENIYLFNSGWAEVLSTQVNTKKLTLQNHVIFKTEKCDSCQMSFFQARHLKVHRKLGNK